jgi:hypothetical protein
VLVGVAVPVLAVAPLGSPGGGGLIGALTSAVTAAPPAPHAVAPSVQKLQIPGNVALRPAVAPGAAGTASPAPAQFSQDTQPFSMLSASWDDGSLASGAHVQFEAREGGAWSDWADLDPTDMAPDNGSADAAAVTAEGGKTSSDGVWVGNADAVRIRVVGGAAPTGLQLTLINPGSSAADAAVTGNASSSGVAHAATPQPPIHSRADWGADESLRSRNPGCGTPQYTSTIKVGFVHHTVTSNDYTPDQVPGLLRAIYADHVLSNGWCDIGYNFVIDKFGGIWEGRYGGINQAVLGAHTGGFNANSFGVSMLGNYDTTSPNGTQPTPAMLDSLERLLAWKLGMYGRDATGTTTLVSAGGSDTRYPAGQVVTLGVISGHRDVDPTTCPGQAVYDDLPTIRNVTKIDELGAALVDPKVVNDLSPNGGPVVVTSGLLQPGTWQLTVTDASGAVVQTLSGSGDPSNPLTASWDRTDSAGATVPNGAYKLTLTSTQNGIDAVPWTTTVVLGRTVGAVNQSFGSSPGRLTVQGWAIRDGDTGFGSIRVVVAGGFTGTFYADLPRSDVAASYPAWGLYHGFDATVPAAPGANRVCVYGVNPGIADTQLGCRDVDVAGPARAATDSSGNPIGNLDGLAVPTPGKLVIHGWAIDVDTRGGMRTDIYVDGRGMASLTADQSRPDIARVYPGYGDRHGFSTTLSLPGGTHQVCAFGINVGAGSGNPAISCKSVTLPTGPPRGAYDVATMTGLGQVLVRGWAYDPDTVDPIRIDFYADGHGLTSVQADGNRPDVAALYPMYGASHGFQTTLRLGGGTHSVCAFAINVAGGGNTLLGCRTVSLPTGSPKGLIDAATVTAPGQLQLRGWAFDPDVADSVRVDVYVDGKGATSVQATDNRPDIARLFPLYGAAHGFHTTLKLTGGKHDVCLFAINIAGGGNTLLGCRTVSLPTGSVYGSFDSAAAVGPGQVDVRGWALDPDTTDPVRVDFYVDGKGNSSATADGNRPDIAKAFPLYGAAHGFDKTLTVASGKHQVCAYAINVGGGAPNTLLACKAVTVP